MPCVVPKCVVPYYYHEGPCVVEVVAALLVSHARCSQPRIARTATTTTPASKRTYLVRMYYASGGGSGLFGKEEGGKKRGKGSGTKVQCLFDLGFDQLVP